jgi:hypothetical protein
MPMPFDPELKNKLLMLFQQKIQDSTDPNNKTFIETAIEICEELDIEPEALGSLIRDCEPLRQTIAKEAREINMLPKDKNDTVSLFD